MGEIMCGITGLVLKDKSLEPVLGVMLSDILATQTIETSTMARVPLADTDWIPGKGGF